VAASPRSAGRLRAAGAVLGRHPRLSHLRQELWRRGEGRKEGQGRGTGEYEHKISQQLDHVKCHSAHTACQPVYSAPSSIPYRVHRHLEVHLLRCRAHRHAVRAARWNSSCRLSLTPSLSTSLNNSCLTRAPHSTSTSPPALPRTSLRASRLGSLLGNLVGELAGVTKCAEFGEERTAVRRGGEVEHRDGVGDVSVSVCQ
jgi:hypothetical protein